MSTDTKTDRTNHNPRLDPIENPKNLKKKLAYWLTKRKMGKVITPLKVLYARFPQGLSLGKALVDMESKFTIDEELCFLIQTYIATLNGCNFCIDIAKASFQKGTTDVGKLEELYTFEKSPLFTDAEKAALAYAKEATQNKQVSNNTFERLEHFFTETEIAQITMINAIENFYNLMNAPLNIGSDGFCALWSKENQK